MVVRWCMVAVSWCRNCGLLLTWELGGRSVRGQGTAVVVAAAAMVVVVVVVAAAAVTVVVMAECWRLGF